MKVAPYARVSTERQADRGTIGSQLAVLREQLTAAGHDWSASIPVPGLDWPGLDLLRDAAEAGCSRPCSACLRHLGDRRGAGAALTNLGVVLRQVRWFDEAITPCQRGRPVTSANRPMLKLRSGPMHLTDHELAAGSSAAAARIEHRCGACSKAELQNFANVELNAAATTVAAGLEQTLGFAVARGSCPQ